MVTATFPNELIGRSEKMESEREEKNRKQKNGRRQTVRGDAAIL